MDPETVPGSPAFDRIVKDVRYQFKLLGLCFCSHPSFSTTHITRFCRCNHADMFTICIHLPCIVRFLSLWRGMLLNAELSTLQP